MSTVEFIGQYCTAGLTVADIVNCPLSSDQLEAINLTFPVWIALGDEGWNVHPQKNSQGETHIEQALKLRRGIL